MRSGLSTVAVSHSEDPERTDLGINHPLVTVHTHVMTPGIRRREGERGMERASQKRRGKREERKKEEDVEPCVVQSVGVVVKMMEH